LGQREKFLAKILRGMNDSDIAFDELCQLLYYFGFSSRVKGSHHIFYRDDIDEIINIQPIGGKAKAYQVKHVRNIIINYKLGDELGV